MSTYILLKRSINEENQEKPEFVETVLLVGAYLEKADLKDEWWELTRLAHLHCPTDFVLATAHIESLRRQGKKEEALALAKEVSVSPEELVNNAKWVLAKASEQINSKRTHFDSD